MKKYKIFIFPAICIIIVVGTFIFLFNLRGKVEEKNYNVNETEETSSTNVENVSSEENEVVNNEISNDTDINLLENKTDEPTVYDQNQEIGATDKKAQAIDLVKKQWGEDSTVTFRCDHVTSSGEYVIAVISKDSASVKNYFKVNLEENTVEVDY